MKTPIFPAFFAFLLLAGCATPEQQAAQARQQQFEAEQRQIAYWQNLRSRCEAYGFLPGSDQFKLCLMQSDQAQKAQDAALLDAAGLMLLQRRLQNQAR